LSAVTTHFEHVVRSKLIANKLAGTQPDSIRALARAMAKGDPVKAETFKRSLFKWMSPGIPQPTPASRALVADALGLEMSDLDEEDDPVNIGDAIQRMFDAAVARAIDRHLSSIKEQA
jgi:hypothetical protein